MEVSESEAHANGEIESAPQPPNEPSTIYSLSSLGRQNSIYALTLDEFQHSFREDGKNFGSMNMDEFLTSIWTAEENQGVHSNKETSQLNQAEPTGEKSLPRQGSLTLPAPLCRKTVEEIWTEISREQQEKQKQQQQSNNVGNPGTTQRQPTLGEMTLEDFLVKAGVVREACGASSQHHIQTPATPAPAPQQYGAYELYQNSNTGVDLNFRIGPVAAPGGAVVQESSNYGLRRNGGFPGEASFGGRAGNVGRYEAAQRLMMGSPTSPVSSDGKCVAQVNNSGSTQYGLEMGGMRGRKRIGEGPPEKLVERRQRRMIKNRESAARSRARKQAYTVELEAELNQLKEENDRLKQILTENEKRKLEKDKPPPKVQNNEEKFRLMRSLSLP